MVGRDWSGTAGDADGGTLGGAAARRHVRFDGIVELFENTCGSVDVSGLCGGT